MTGAGVQKQHSHEIDGYDFGGMKPPAGEALHRMRSSSGAADDYRACHARAHPGSSVSRDVREGLRVRSLRMMLSSHTFAPSSLKCEVLEDGTDKI
jgi:hypothetical protein